MAWISDSKRENAKRQKSKIHFRFINLSCGQTDIETWQDYWLTWLYIQNVPVMVRLENLVSSKHICTIPPPTKEKQWNRIKWRESGKVINLDRERERKSTKSTHQVLYIICMTLCVTRRGIGILDDKKGYKTCL